ncbi:MAG TPA: TetR/AcrR family transcriptional regulator C-terminal domain-containing protein [Propionibacteriaceae bacterium]|nr:TetR/AcrR family transcriptional regulator C-terminal domain-containing protein [Propionibacteriaceae bacterium]
MTRTTKRAERRAPLSRERVLDAAIRLADRGGLESLTMRRLGQELGVEGMALYYHFANKDEVIDGIVDLVFGEIDLPAAGADWKTAMRQRAQSLREVLLRHRWALGLMESRRTPGPANLRHHDAVIGSLRSAGLDMPMIAHAYSLLDSYIYGFALFAMNLPFQPSEEVAELGRVTLKGFPVDAYPNLVAYISAMTPGYNYGDEFEYGLDLVLDGLAREAGASRPELESRPSPTAEPDARPT